MSTSSFSSDMSSDHPYEERYHDIDIERDPAKLDFDDNGHLQISEYNDGQGIHLEVTIIQQHPVGAQIRANAKWPFIKKVTFLFEDQEFGEAMKKILEVQDEGGLLDYIIIGDQGRL
ncbi:hypothetical protein VNI00_019356 [Paramarasmius palmivorus]|uniref:Uncharacterized protein n=1 Tax=Paramarasmius palmivorus TaxID=297713 RepID=A0AAW0AMN3_9AGAR